MSKYTAGPWKADWTTSNSGQTRNGWHVTDAKATEFVIEIPDGPCAKANAHLMAAAPDMYEALNEIAEDVMAYFDKDHKEPEVAMWADGTTARKFKNILAALKKAEGLQI